MPAKKKKPGRIGGRKLQRLDRELRQEVATTFRSKLEREDLSQHDLARVMDRKHPSINLMLNGTNNTTLQTLAELAYALKCRVKIRLVPLSD
jgi:ribosome-binding protein aMBF1 (putative translation factor)